MTLNLVFIIVAFTNMWQILFLTLPGAYPEMYLFSVLHPKSMGLYNCSCMDKNSLRVFVLFFLLFFSFFLLYVMKKDMYISLNFNIFKHQIVLSDIALDTYFKSQELSM